LGSEKYLKKQKGIISNSDELVIFERWVLYSAKPIVLKGVYKNGKKQIQHRHSGMRQSSPPSCQSN
jgi:hypothetical protein